jgi:predicted outer membrane lipoprotein
MTDGERVPNENPLPRLEAMTFGMILDRAINLYFRNFGLVFGIMAVSQVINQINYVIFSETMKGTLYVATVVYTPVYFLVNLLTMAVGTGAVTIAISSRYLGREITILQSYRIAFRKLWTLLGARFVAGLLVGLGFLLFFIPGILLAVAFSLITPVVMLEDTSARKCRERSRELTKGFRWQIFALFLIYYIVYYTIAWVFGTLLTAVSILILPAFAAQPYTSQLLLAPLLILPTPIPALFTVLIYYNQRIRKEGFDLAVLAEALARE